MVAFLDNIDHKEILRQSSEAVSFLNGLDMIHRNLHPDNFLVSFLDRNKKHFLIKLTDFQLSKNIEKEPENTGNKAKGWVAPESFVINYKLTNKLDAFIMGCYYYYVLSEGKHPFDGIKPRNIDDRRANVKNPNFKVYQPNIWNGGSDWNAAIESTTIHVCIHHINSRILMTKMKI